MRKRTAARRRPIAKAVLNQLVKAYRKLSVSQQQDLWCILSALRGPDISDCWELKERTTLVIRQAVGFDTYRPPKPKTITLYLPKDMEKGGSHFIAHIHAAAHALGIKVREVTPDDVCIS